MIWTTKRISALAACLLIAGLASGCAKNPATGGTTFTGGFSEADEIRVGRETHPKITKEFGGEYGTADLKRYVDSIGQLLAKTSERPHLKWTFTILNSDIVNAFATPGGYVYVTRGLMALADNEAQLAGVLAHEIAHITALHHAERQGQSLLANVGVIAAAVLGGRAGAELGQLGAVSMLQRYSRDNEHEADALGVRYLSRAGYDPGAMAGFLSKLRDSSRLDAKRRGQSPDTVDQFHYLASHPAPAARVERATGLAQKASVKNPITARDLYLSKLDGMLYGDAPDQGFVRGREFLHPKLRFAFRIPKGFSVFNTTQAVHGFGPANSRFIFDGAKPHSGSMVSYVGRVWGKNLRLRDLERINVKGVEAATANAQARSGNRRVDLRLVAYRLDGSIYRFIFVTPTNQTAALSEDLRRMTYSFRALNGREARNLKPLALKVRTVRRGETVSGIARRLPFPDFREERFRVLNGLGENEGLRAGQKIKIVTLK